MDPFSITTGVITLIGACATISQTLAKLRLLGEAPDLINAINNEISTLQLLLTSVKSYLESVEGDSDSPDVDDALFRSCNSMLGQIQAKVLEMDSFIRNRLLKEDGAAGPRISRRVLLKNPDKLISFQLELRESRQKLCDFGGILGLRQIGRLEIKLEAGTRTLLQGQRKMQQQLDCLVNRRPNRSDLRYLTPDNSQRSFFDDNRSVKISVRKQQPSSTAVKCTCPRDTSTEQFQSFLGTLFLGYTTARLVPPCPHPHQTVRLVAYYFPMWFLRYVLLMHFSYSITGLSEFSISFVQIIPHDHSALNMIKFGEIEELKYLLKSGQLSPKAQLPNGATLLHWAIWHANTLSTKLLLESKADMYYESPIYLSPQVAAWDRILIKDESHEWRETLGILFPKPDFEEHYAFSPLHQAVLRLTDRSIRTVLEEDKDQINSVDVYGRTALSWATWRSDHLAVEALLEYKPNCNIPDRDGATPLAYASATSAECLKLLLGTDADVQIRHRRTKGTLLHLAIKNLRRNYEGIKKVEMLVEAGVDVNAQDINGETALHVGAYPQKNFLRSARYLISRGANPEIYDKRGNNILSNAVQRNYHALIGLLLQQRTDHTQHLDDYGTFMHLAAEIANAETLHLLARGQLKPRDVNVRNKAGLTPIQLAINRGKIDPEWHSAFIIFLSTIDQDIRRGLDEVERHHLSYQAEALELRDSDETDTSQSGTSYSSGDEVHDEEGEEGAA